MKENQKSGTPLSSNRVLPTALDAEKAVIGALIAENEALLRVEEVLNADDFYLKSNVIIFQAVTNLSAKKKAIDMITVSEELKSMGELDRIGGIPMVAELAMSVISSAHIEHHAHIVKQKSLARKLIFILQDTIEKCFDETNDIADVIEELDTEFTRLVTSTATRRSWSMPEAIRLTMDKISKIQSDKEKGISPGIPAHLDRLTKEFAGGWTSPDLIVIGGRPSMGKTQHALQIAEKAAMSNYHTLFCSIEMTAPQLITRLLLKDDAINEFHIRNGSMTQDEWKALDLKVKEIYDAKLHIADDPGIRYLTNIKVEARRLKRSKELDLLIIDYLGLIKTNQKFAMRQLEVAHITSELKALAKELNIPIVLLSQLSRLGKNVALREPILEDLRESGDIEQDADVVLFIHKPDYYEEGALDDDGIPWKNRGKIIVGKHREGSRNRVILFEHDKRYKNIFDYHGNRRKSLL
ncbi:MAG: replicative DNA helicase [Bacteroidales bacterium]|nr:replicative DNA helicase [Bacteroidales bacterium]